MKLAKIAITTTSIELPYPAYPQFKVKVGYISRELQRKIHSDSQVPKFDEQYQVTTNELDPKVFASNYAKNAIVGWSGLTPEVLSNLILIDVDAVKKELEAKGEKEVEYNEENALYLMTNNAAFDRWVTEQCSKLSTFRK